MGHFQRGWDRAVVEAGAADCGRSASGGCGYGARRRGERGHWRHCLVVPDYGSASGGDAGRPSCHLGKAGVRYHCRLRGASPTDFNPLRYQRRVGSGRRAQRGDLLVPAGVEMAFTESARRARVFGKKIPPSPCDLFQFSDRGGFLLRG
jgi:hypothetical protein